MSDHREQFLADLRKTDPDAVGCAIRVIAWFATVRAVTTDSTPKEGYVFNLRHTSADRHPYHLCYLTRGGEIKFHITRLHRRGKPKPDGQTFPPFDDEPVRAEMGARLQKITRTPPPHKTNGVCTFPVRQLEKEEAFDEFRSIIEWMIETINRS